MLIRITDFEEIRALALKEGFPTEESIKCKSCGKVIAFWAKFNGKERFFRPIKNHTQILCGIHPKSAKTKDELNFEKLFVFGFECCGFNTLGKLAKNFIPEINDLGEKIVLRDNPEPEQGKGCFINLKEILIVEEKRGKISTNREMYLQTDRGRFYEILDFLKSH